MERQQHSGFVLLKGDWTTLTDTSTFSAFSNGIRNTKWEQEKHQSSACFDGAHLIVPVLLQEVAGHVARQDVPQHVLVVFSQLLHLVDLLLGLDAPQEVQPGRVLQLKTQVTGRYRGDSSSVAVGG